MHAFREAVEARDLSAVDDMLAEDVVFRSPVAHAPYSGKALTSAILHQVIQVFEGFHYVRELHSDTDGDAFVFACTVDGLELTGCDFLTYDEAGLISEFMVMVRPLKAAQALAARMAERYPAIVAGLSH